MENKAGKNTENNIDYGALIEKLNSREGFTGHNGMVVTKMEPGYAEMECRLVDEGKNAHGLAHGALLFALCDEVTAFTIYEEGMYLLTASANINFIRAGKAGVLRAVGKCKKRGRQMSFVDAEVFDEDNELLCSASMVYYHRNQS